MRVRTWLFPSLSIKNQDKAAKERAEKFALAGKDDINPAHIYCPRAMVELRSRFFANHEAVAAKLELFLIDFLLLLEEPARSFRDEHLCNFDETSMPSLEFTPRSSIKNYPAVLTESSEA